MIGTVTEKKKICSPCMGG